MLKLKIIQSHCTANHVDISGSCILLVVKET